MQSHGSICVLDQELAFENGLSALPYLCLWWERAITFQQTAHQEGNFFKRNAGAP
jgi:hypothetical protein